MSETDSPVEHTAIPSLVVPGPIVPVPRLHQAFACAPPAGMNTNCPSAGWLPGDCPPWSAPLVNLPLSPAQVRACRADLASLDPDELARAVQVAATERLGSALSGTEAAALQSFTSRFSAVPAKVAQGPDIRHAQYMLLLVWAQEERLLEIAELTRHCEASEEHLRVILGDDLDRTACDDIEDIDMIELRAMGLHELKPTGKQHLPSSPAAPDQDLLALLPPWAFVLEHMQTFLPDNAVLLINDPALAEVIRNVGVVDNQAGTSLYRVRAARLSSRFSASGKEYCCLLPDHADGVHAGPEGRPA